MSRSNTDVTEPHHDIKALVALEGKSIKQYTLERLLPADESAALL
jgi:Antitoxin ParD